MCTDMVVVHLPADVPNLKNPTGMIQEHIRVRAGVGVELAASL